MREARFEAGTQIPKSSHLDCTLSVPTTSSCARVHKAAGATRVVAGTDVKIRNLAEHDERV